MLTDIQPLSLTSDNEAGINLWVKITVRNVGHSPAQNVSVSASLLIDGFDAPPDQAVVLTCQQGRTGSWIIPGRPVFPDQAGSIDGDTPTAFMIPANKVWAARAARIKSIYDNRLVLAHETRERAQEWADATAEFPFYAPLSLVGCINYRSSDNAALYQTGFMSDFSEKGTGRLFPLLSKENPVSLPPTPMPGDLDGVVVYPRKMQRVIPGDQIKVGTPLYGSFAY